MWSWKYTWQEKLCQNYSYFCNFSFGILLIAESIIFSVFKSFTNCFVCFVQVLEKFDNPNTTAWSTNSSPKMEKHLIMRSCLHTKTHFGVVNSTLWNKAIANMQVHSANRWCLEWAGFPFHSSSSKYLIQKFMLKFSPNPLVSYSGLEGYLSLQLECRLSFLKHDLTCN